MFHPTSSCVNSAKKIVYFDCCVVIGAQPWQRTFKLKGYSAASHVVFIVLQDWQEERLVGPFPVQSSMSCCTFATSNCSWLATKLLGLICLQEKENILLGSLSAR